MRTEDTLNTATVKEDLEEAKKGLPLETLKGAQLCQVPDFGFRPCRTVRAYIAIVLGHLVGGDLL